MRARDVARVRRGGTTSTIGFNNVDEAFSIFRARAGDNLPCLRINHIPPFAQQIIPARLIGVQWHPELLRGDPVHERFFDWLVTEAARPLTASRDELSDVA